LTLEGTSAVRFNTADDLGGGIRNEGAVIFSGGRVRGNTAVTYGASGGGLCSSASASQTGLRPPGTAGVNVFGNTPTNASLTCGA
jgi:hypothetical protein